MNVEETVAYRCGKCGRVFVDKAMAEKCCLPGKCDMCGCELPPYHTRCDACSEIYKWNHAENHMTYDEYVAKTGHGMLYYHERFYDEWEDLVYYLEANEEDFPQDNIGIYGITQEKLCFSFDNLYYLLSDNAYEDWEMDEDQQQKIEEFCADYKNIYADTILWPDYNTAIIPG